MPTVNCEIQILLAPNDAFHALSAQDQARVREVVQGEAFSPEAAVGAVLDSWAAVPVESDAWGRVSEEALRIVLERELGRYAQARGQGAVQVENGAPMAFHYCKVGDMWVCYPSFPLHESGAPWVLQDAGGFPGVDVAFKVQARWPV